jgi:hypothetical protein
VVVAVDQPGRGEAAGRVDALVGGRAAALADRGDPPVVDDDVAVGVLGAGGVDGGDRAVVDDGGHDAASRTASRIFS